ncbi:hypothetical protein H0H87_005563, partial [Tephrocybe sp. NHM501043]
HAATNATQNALSSSSATRPHLPALATPTTPPPPPSLSSPLSSSSYPPSYPIPSQYDPRFNIDNPSPANIEYPPLAHQFSLNAATSRWEPQQQQDHFYAVGAIPHPTPAENTYWDNLIHHPSATGYMGASSSSFRSRMMLI